MKLHQNCKNAVHTKLPPKPDKKCQSNQIYFHSQPTTLPKDALAKFYLSTTFGLMIMIISVVPTSSSDFYAYLITKVETLASNELSSVLLNVPNLVASHTVPFICMFYKSFHVEYTLVVNSQRECFGV